MKGGSPGLQSTRQLRAWDGAAPSTGSQGNQGDAAEPGRGVCWGVLCGVVRGGQEKPSQKKGRTLSSSQSLPPSCLELGPQDSPGLGSNLSTATFLLSLGFPTSQLGGCYR